MALNPYQEQVVRAALALPEADGFALAGGGAMLAHQLVERPTQDSTYSPHSTEACRA